MGADQEVPRLDADGAESSRPCPRVVRKVTMDLLVALGLHDQQYADATVLSSGKRSGEEDHASVRERVHERRVLVHRRLVEDATLRPCGPGFADDGERAHVRTARTSASVESRCLPAMFTMPLLVNYDP